jgi:hypothetical protein
MTEQSILTKKDFKTRQRWLFLVMVNLLFSLWFIQEFFFMCLVNICLIAGLYISSYVGQKWKFLTLYLIVPWVLFILALIISIDEVGFPNIRSFEAGFAAAVLLTAVIIWHYTSIRLILLNKRLSSSCEYPKPLAMQVSLATARMKNQPVLAETDKDRHIRKWWLISMLCQLALTLINFAIHDKEFRQFGDPVILRFYVLCLTWLIFHFSYLRRGRKLLLLNIGVNLFHYLVLPMFIGPLFKLSSLKDGFQDLARLGFDIWFTYTSIKLFLLNKRLTRKNSEIVS